ncbi:hypothetical protein BU16DRAFT_326346 [Lophium mytilinum]|uniref:Glutamyl-tRNA amidotransferase complex subunit Gta3 domain-containing protein n=1 Tax=Lophium mytilinum TaxID=390894 RepID=A0A6A6QZC5_9PEZI|nr:hypothetical protein BU16DRAFT_326346 [Lophium mytilinum]
MATGRSLICLRAVRPSILLLSNVGRSMPWNIKRHNSSEPLADWEQQLARPSWSVQSLLPSDTQTADAPTISVKQLHHLLRLSALPLPASAEEEAKMLDTLSSQLHFVREIQEVDTKGVEPLRAIRDETSAAEKEQEINLDTLKDALAKEDVIGKHHKRIRRRTDKIDAKDVEDWEVLGYAERKSGKYFVVDSGKS